MRAALTAFASTAAVALYPPLALAGNQFATAEATRVQDGIASMTSLSASAELTQNDDGIISFDGFALFPAGDTTPLTVHIQTHGREEAPSIEETEKVTGLFSINAAASFSPDIPGVEIEKTLYTLSLPDEEVFGSIAVTDEPLPVVGWLAFATLVSFTGLSIYAIDNCRRIVMAAAADIETTKLETSITCEKE